MESSIDPRISRIIAAQFYVAKNLLRDPAKTIRFMLDNHPYFPSLDEKELENLKNEHNVTDEDLEKLKSHIMADINLEKKIEEKRKKKDAKIHSERHSSRKDRDFGKGFGPNTNMYSSDKEVQNNYQEEPITNNKESNIFETHFKDFNEKFAKFKVNLKEEEFTANEISESSKDLSSEK